MNRTKGFTLVELLVVIAIIALLIGLLLPALAKARANAQSLKDKTQITQVHKAALGFAGENKGKLPVPGLINRKADTFGVGQMSGHGPEDFAQNTSANLYSAMIAQDLFKPELLLGTTEVNTTIRIRTEYDFAKFNPASDTYWDPTFKCDPAIAPGSGESNSSYSHQALMGFRKKNKWNNSQGGSVPHFGNRGTGGTFGGLNNGGATQGDQYTKSPTLRLHLPRNQWVGHVVFSDNHAETLDNFFPPLTSYIKASGDPLALKDNIFAAEFADYTTAQIPGGTGNAHASNDAWLVQCTVVNATHGNIGTCKWDILDQ
jgi:prepilin-type N-terminal cleavage/methylation domain-containing protein